MKKTISKLSAIIFDITDHFLNVKAIIKYKNLKFIFKYF